MNQRLCLGFLLATLSSFAGAVDQNLLPNGDFSSANQVIGWTLGGGGSLSWNSDDADGSASSGSMEVDAVAGSAAVTSPCFAVTPGAAYSYGGQSRRVSTDVGAIIAFSCYSFNAPACPGGTAQGSGLSGSSDTMPVQPAWTAPIGGGTTLPVTAHSVLCLIQVAPIVFGGNTSARLDNLFFNSTAPLTPVRLQSFDVE